MTKKILFLLFLFLAYVGTTAQLRLSFENDALGSFGDNDYSHGTGLALIDDNGWHWKVGQNMYTPSDLKRSDYIKGDRPYAGMIYGGIGHEIFEDETSPWTHYAEIDFGMIGPAAYCEKTQKTIHKWLGCRDPKGWKNQLHNEFVVNAQWWTKYNWQVADWFAIVPRAGALVGTVQDSLEVGCDFKVGYNIADKKDAGNTIMFSSKQKTWIDDFSCYAYAGPCARYVLYNHILEGSMFNSKDDDLGVNIHHFVPEFRLGAALQYKNMFVHYYCVLRSDEFKDQPNRPHYGGLEIGWTF